jgi:hypothetical protein
MEAYGLQPRERRREAVGRAGFGAHHAIPATVRWVDGRRTGWLLAMW